VILGKKRGVTRKAVNGRFKRSVSIPQTQHSRITLTMSIAENEGNPFNLDDRSVVQLRHLRLSSLCIIQGLAQDQSLDININVKV
jgi:hypothetical protein